MCFVPIADTTLILLNRWQLRARLSELQAEQPESSVEKAKPEQNRSEEASNELHRRFVEVSLGKQRLKRIK